KNVQRLLINYKTGDEQVEFAVVVVVEPNRTGRPAGCSDTGLVSHISKRAVTIVAIQNIAAVTRDIEINPTVAIVIAGGDAHAEGATSHSGFVGHVCERAIVVVMVKGIL